MAQQHSLFIVFNVVTIHFNFRGLRVKHGVHYVSNVKEVALKADRIIIALELHFFTHYPPILD